MPQAERITQYVEIVLEPAKQPTPILDEIVHEQEVTLLDQVAEVTALEERIRKWNHSTGHAITQTVCPCGRKWGDCIWRSAENYLDSFDEYAGF